MTRGEFERKYVQLRQKSPGHALMSVISRGYSPLACEYLQIALSESLPEEKITDDTYFKRRAHLYSKRAVLSNRLFDCTNDVERADISLQIGDLQHQIIEVNRAINYLKETGKLIPLKFGNHIPEDGRTREKKLRSIRSSISYIKKKLKDAKTDREKLKYERKLTDLQSFAGELS